MSDETQDELELNPAPKPLAMYVSEVPRLQILDFQFTQKGDSGHLELFEPEQVAEMDAELARLAKVSPGVRRLVKTLSLEAAESLIATLVTRPVAAQGALSSSEVKAAQALGSTLTSMAGK